MAACRMAKLRVGWMFAGCAPGVFTIERRIWFQSSTGWPDSRACGAPCRCAAAEAPEVRAAGERVEPTGSPLPSVARAHRPGGEEAIRGLARRRRERRFETVAGARPA